MSDLFLKTNSLLKNSDEASVSKCLESRGDNLEFLSIEGKSKVVVDQVKWVITHKKTNYLAELLLLADHKSVSVRRKAAEALGTLGSVDLIPDIEAWQLGEADRDTWLMLDDCADKLKRKSKGDDLDYSVNVLTVSEALKRAKLIISEKKYVIEGELSDVKLSYSMYYFSIKDSEGTKIDCSCYSGKVAGFGFPLNEGWEVRITGKFKIDNLSRLKFDVENMKLSGEGEILRKLQLLEEKLEKEGLFDPFRERPINSLPTKILLLASSASAALQDFQKVLKGRRSGITIYHLPIKTQGVGAEFEILNNLEMANELTAKFGIDTIVVTRGGGSKEDLMLFNSEKVVRAIHSLNRPSIVAIGHERDHTLAERAGDIRGSTPSNAAEMCSISDLEVNQELYQIASNAQSYFLQRKSDYLNFTNLTWGNSLSRVQIRINQEKELVNGVQQQIFGIIRQSSSQVASSFYQCLRLVQGQVRDSKLLVGSMQQYILGTSSIIQSEKQRINYFWLNHTLQFKNRLSQIKFDFNNSFSAISLLDPKHVLSLGYAMIYQNNKLIERKNGLDLTQKIVIQLQDGSIEL